MSENIIEPFKVCVRIRPLLPNERKLVYNENLKGKKIPYQIVNSDNNTILLKDPNNPELYGQNVKSFPFDKVFTEKDNNKTIFNSIIINLVDNILQGYNSTALAYGVTGAGKTHTMFGDLLNNNCNINNINKTEEGICMYAVDYLFRKISELKNKVFTIKISYLELYNEQVIDLLTIKPSNEGIMIVEDPNKGVLLPGLSELIVKDSDEVYNYILKGNSRRTMGSTGQNQFSSRSHAILEINIEQCEKNIEKSDILISKMLYVDLAGSEKGGKEKIRREEGGNINKSLLALGNCINILSDKNKKNSFVPYRDSKLTRLLKDSLGGNIATIMIACVSPCPLTYEETHSTLKYASRANKIEKKVTKNYKEIDQSTAQFREMISSLRNEITHLKDIIRSQHEKIRNRNLSVWKKNYNEENLNILNEENKNNFNKKNYKDDDEDINILSNSIFSHNDLISPNFKENGSGILINFSSDIYNNLLNKNLNELSDQEFQDLEKKMDILYYDKINLEEKMKNGLQTLEISEMYIQIKNFYEKFINTLNEKMAENTEQNMIIKFHLKELFETNQQNSKNLNSVDELLKNEYNKNERERLNTERNNFKKELDITNIEIKKYSQILQKNKQRKSFLKKLFIKFISNTQINENKDFQNGYQSLINEKKELELKAQKYRECFNSILKEKESKTQEIFNLTNEIEKTKFLINTHDSEIIELEKKIREIEINNEDLLKDYNHQSPTVRSMISFIEEFENHSKKRENSVKENNRFHHRSDSTKNLTSINGSENGNKYLTINLIQQVPTITAFINDGDIYSHDNSLINSISKLRFNLTAKPSKSTSKTKPRKREGNTII
jgi:kinesin family protein 18/19